MTIDTVGLSHQFSHALNNIPHCSSVQSLENVITPVDSGF